MPGQVVGTISIKVTPDTSKFRRELHDELTAIEKAEEAKVKVKADFDADGLREKVKAAAESADARAKVKVDVNTDYLKGRILQDLKGFRTKVKVDVDVDRSVLDRLRARGGGLFGGGGRVGGGGFGGGGFGGGLGSIGNFGSPANLLAIFSLLPPALAIAAPALASLPALIAGVVAPIGVVALGMDGLKKAAEDAGLAVAGKKGKLGVGPALKQIQQGVSDVFAKGFTPILQELLTVAQPATTAMRGVAQGIVNLTKGLVDTLVSPAIQNQLQTLFANIGGALSTAAPGISSFTTGLINLATQVSTHFPGLASWFNQLGEKFSNWVSKISKDGSLDKAISGLRPVLDAIVSFVGRLFDAGIKLASDPKMMDNIKSLLDSITNLTINALPGLTQFFNSIASLAKDLGLDKPQTPNSFQPAAPGSNGQFSWYNAPKKDVKPGFLDQLETGDWWKQNVLDPVKRFFSGKTQNQQGFGGKDSPFGHTTTALGNFFTGNSEWEHTLGRNVGGPIGRFFTGDNQWEKSLGNGVSSGFNKISQGAQSAVDQVKNVFAGLPSAVSGIWDGIVSQAQAAWDKLVSATTTAIGKVEGFFSALPGKIIGILSSLGNQLFSAGAAAMGRLADGVKSAVGKVTGAVKGALGGILNLIPHSPAPEGPFSAAGWNQLLTGGQAIGDQFRTGLENGFQGVIQSATDLLGQVHGALANGVIPPQLKDNLRAELKAIGTEYDTLKVQRDALDPKDKTGRKAISDQMKQLQTLRDQLKLGRDQFPDAKKPDKDKLNIPQMLGKEVQKLPGLGVNFAMANVQQFEQDLGISGSGAIPQIANIGVQWASSAVSNLIGSAFGDPKQKGDPVHIHVNNVDDALAARQNIQNKKQLERVGR